MPRIIPIKDLKNTSAISDLCHQSNDPVFVTKNGYEDLVMMSMTTYEMLFKRLEMYKELAISEKQFEEGDFRNATDAVSDIRSKYGL